MSRKSKFVVSKKEKQEEFEEKLPMDLIKNLMENHSHSYGMIWDMLNRDFKQELGNISFELDNLQGFRNIIKEFNFDYSHKEYLSKPTEFRVQYKYSKNKSLEGIKNQLKNSSREGAKITHNIRRDKENYNPHYTIDFWKEKIDTNDEEKARKALEESKRNNSPFNVNFWIRKGLAEEEAIEKVKDLQIKGTKATLRKQKSNISSNLEEKFSGILEENNVDYEQQFIINLKEGEKKYNKKIYCYDFFLIDIDTLVEINGTYWHFDKRKYDADEKVIHPRLGEIYPTRIWKKDDHKKNIALERGYKFLTFWEKDIMNNSQKIIEEIKNEQ